MQCVHFDEAQIHTQVMASFFPFGHPAQAAENYLRELREVIYGSARKAALKWLFWQITSNLRLLARPFGHPSQVCLHKLAFPNLR